MNLVRGKAKSDPQKLKEFYPRLKYAADAVSERQAFYAADVNIYGNFVDTRSEIEAAIAVV